MSESTSTSGTDDVLLIATKDSEDSVKCDEVEEIQKESSSSSTSSSIDTQPEASVVSKLQHLISADDLVGWPDKHPGYPSLKHGWFFQSHQDVLKYLLSPETTCVIEIGSWLGRSTEYLTKTAPNAVVFAIDLWDDTVIENDTHYNSSAENMAILKSGPLYHRFMSNMWEYRSAVTAQQGCETTVSPGIIPLKMDGCAGLHILKALNITPDLVYIDASHHYASVVKDITTVMEMFPAADVVGDDWDYPDVQRAVKECAKKFKLEIHVSGYKCWTYSKWKCEVRGKEVRKREEADEDAREESVAKRRAITKMSLKDLMGHYKKKK